MLKSPALSASLAMHALAAGVFWAKAVAFPVLPAASGNTVINVQLRPAQPASSPVPQQAAEETPSAQSKDASPATIPNLAPVLPEAASPTGTGFVLPPQEAPYIPAGELDVRPQPQAPVVVPFPDVPLKKGKVSATLVLYIGMDGQVERVEVDQSDLPPPFEKIAVQTFQEAKMLPGMKNGKATRARMKVLVEFEEK